MRTSLVTLEETSPLDYNMEAVLPGVHDRMSAMHSDISLVRLDVKNLSLEVKDYSLEVKKVVRQSEDGASQMVKLITYASQLMQLNGGAGGGAGQASPAPPLNSQRQAAAAAAHDDDDDDDEDDDNFGKAKRHTMKGRYQSLHLIYYEWYGLDISKDQPIVGGFKKCEELFKSSWRKHHTNAEKKHFSRLKMIIQGLQKKAVDEGSPMEEVVDILEETYQKSCNKTISKMADWMMQQGLIPQGKKRATSK
jgi:hypothetical protein